MTIVDSHEKRWPEYFKMLQNPTIYAMVILDG